jgi:hypothetical protein
LVKGAGYLRTKSTCLSAKLTTLVIDEPENCLIVRGSIDQRGRIIRKPRRKLSVSMIRSCYCKANESKHRDIDNFDILLWLLLVHPRVLDLMNNIQALDSSAKNGMFAIKPRLHAH